MLTEAHKIKVLSGPSMFHCPCLSTGAATLSVRQCLFNQRRNRVHGFPHSCSADCKVGAKHRRKHSGEKVPEVTYNILKGDFGASNRETEIDAPVAPAPSTRIAQNKKKIHLSVGTLKLLGKTYLVSACGKRDARNLRVTEDLAAVTCGECKTTFPGADSLPGTAGT